MNAVMQKRKEIDKGGMFKIIRNTPLHLREGREAVKQGPLQKALSKIKKNRPKYLINCGVGGSALSPEIFKLLMKNGDIVMSELPTIYSNKHYFLPDWIKKVKALVIYNSYSGNTEEVISCLFHGLKMGLKNQIVISSGGQLSDLAQKYDLPLIRLPSHFLPRLAINYHFAVLSAIYQIVFSLNISDELDNTSRKLDRMALSIEKEGYRMALLLQGRIPLIYTSSTLKILGYIWKIKLNENAEIPAFFNHIPEMNHNEIVGLSGFKKIFTQPLFYALMINSEDDHLRIHERIKITESVFDRLDIDYSELNIGPRKFYSIFRNILLADWTSYYLSLLYGVDPAPTAIIDEIKQRLSKSKLVL